MSSSANAPIAMSATGKNVAEQHAANNASGGANTSTASAPASVSATNNTKSNDDGGDDDFLSILPDLSVFTLNANYENAPDVTNTLTKLAGSTAALSKSFAAVAEASASQVGELTEFMFGQLEKLAEHAEATRDASEVLAVQSEVFMAKCAQLNRQLSRLDRLEGQIAYVEKHLPQLEVLVDARIKRAEAENAAAKHRQHQAAAK